MQLTFNKHTALFIMRQLRADASRARLLSRRAGAFAPDPSPRKHWTRKGFQKLQENLPFSLGESPYAIVVPNPNARTNTSIVKSTLYSDGIPEPSFVRLGRDVAISGPELLFVELAQTMHPVEHLMLGHELCGTFSRDARNPYNGPIIYDVAPLTSVEKISRFLTRAKSIRGIEAARASLAYLSDNAWSPTESLIAAFMCLPVDCLGYDLGNLVLNPRVDLAQPLPGAKGKRFPDIVVEGTPVGINYDGLLHLDLDSIAKAAMEVGSHPEASQPETALHNAMSDVRHKAVDDIRRNRELATSGLSVFPVLKEDLYEPDGFDQIIAHIVNALERHTDRDLSVQKILLQTRAFSKPRHQMMLSLLPGKRQRDIQVCRRIGDLMLYEAEPGMSECWIEL